jgi:hypothetical protein
VPPRKASGPATDSVNQPLAIDHASDRRVANKSQAKKQDGPRSLSPMENAFLAGLVYLAQRGDASIAPADDVAPHEIRRAIHALVRAKGDGGA